MTRITIIGCIIIIGVLWTALMYKDKSGDKDLKAQIQALRNVIVSKDRQIEIRDDKIEYLNAVIHKKDEDERNRLLRREAYFDSLINANNNINRKLK